MNLTPDILKKYLRRLTNLSSRNRSLLLSTLSADQFLDWKALDFVDNRSAFDVLSDLIAQKKTVRLGQVIDPRSEKGNEVSKRLRKLSRTERFIEEERGSEDLYVGYPFVRGKLMDGTVIHAPLVYFPVTLQKNEENVAYWELRRRPEPTLLNRSFLLAYGYFNQVTIPDELLEKNLEELSRDSLVFRTELYELLKESALKLNFNQAIFQDTLQYFDECSKSDLELLEQNGELKLYPEAVLGIFPQAGSYLAPDYEALISQEEKRVDDEEASAFSVPIKEANTFTAFPQDASQEQALLRVKQGESLVVEGPPGTGKSQLIANLMTDFAARGKRVLLVCQKRVALDVVYERLRQVGVAPFAALIHDFKNDRADLYAQLDAQIGQVDEYQKQNYALDSIVLERQFLQVSRSIEQLCSELNAFKEALFDANECGLSPKELYLTSSSQEANSPIPQFRQFRFDDRLETFLQKLRRLEQYQRFLPSPHPWEERVDFSRIGITAVKNTIEEAIQTYEYTQKSTSEWLGQTLNAAHLRQLHRLDTQVRTWQERLQLPMLWDFFERSVSGKMTKSLAQWLPKAHKSGQKLMGGSVLMDELSTSELPRFEHRLQALIQARQSVVKWLFYSDKDYFRDLTVSLGLTLELTDLYQLRQRLENRKALEQWVDEVENKLAISIRERSMSQTLLRWEEVAAAMEQAAQLQLEMQQNAPFLANLALKGKDEWASVTKQLLTLASEFSGKYQRWQRYLTQGQLLRLEESAAYGAELKKALEVNFDALVEMDSLKNELPESEREIYERLQTETLHSWIDVVQNSLRLAWLAHLEEKNPVLRAVSSLKMSQWEEELQQLIEQKQALSREILGMQLREQTYKEISFNRLQNRTTYRELQHQVTKKRKIWPVRKLMEHHAEEVFRLVPCWMASPETVSAVFPLRHGLFDVVIFDEASQCYAEYGIPAIYRAKQAVIVGDSKQLAPYDLYRARYENETEEEQVALEVESLLDLAKHFYSDTLLQGHYRSRSLDLIDFSNQHFYKNKLQLLPHFQDINESIPAIEYAKVDGVWEQNRNTIEAERVVELVKMLQNEQPNASVGVVTFNYPQQQLIEQLLHETVEQGEGGWKKSFFVKNIENVQGDERDIIIFSVGYAPDVRGRFRAQFGSLNARGGENRLNVAVTRARQKVYVVTSIWPDQLQVETAVHSGPKLFKSYLAYALNVSSGAYRPRPLELHKRPSSWLLKHRLQQTALQKEDIVLEELPFADLT
ncbi:MAG TPA: DNA helicase, partial [Runella sp.]|nr:DNA helicase [Runella sp.]